MLRKFAIREDREELGNNTGPRFKSELINPRKGTPTSYIAKYISKNIDGRGLAGEISKETGKSLRDNAEYVNAWASLHRVQQFRFFGIPGRQAYRELRLLAGQAARQQGDKKAGVPVLDNPRLDAILAAADAGCFATYIMKQGGVYWFPVNITSSELLMKLTKSRPPMAITVFVFMASGHPLQRARSALMQ